MEKLGMIKDHLFVYKGVYKVLSKIAIIVIAFPVALKICDYLIYNIDFLSEIVRSSDKSIELVFLMVCLSIYLTIKICLMSLKIIDYLFKWIRDL